MPDLAYLSLGSNLGNRRANIEAALARLEAAGVRVVARSSFYETAPQDLEDQPWFLNMVAACETRHSPQHLMAILLQAEREGGRTRGTRPKGPRVIDLDILLYGDCVIDTPQLTVPHPRMLGRRFVLEPLLEIAPGVRHPVTHQLLGASLDQVAAQPIRKLPD